MMSDAPNLRSPRVALVAPDDPESEAFYRRLLQPCRFLVEPAWSGADALAKALSLRPDIIVADSELGVIDGFALRDLLRTDSDARSIPMVLVTPDEDATRHELPNRDDLTVLLTKSLVEQQLCARVLALCDRGAREEHEADSPRSEPPAPRDSTALRAEPAPVLRCTRCDAVLLYDRTYWGGVRKQVERWDLYSCPSGCGHFEYRHRTRTLRLSGSAAGSHGAAPRS
jgi:CheY-like chemotaxis protein